jgi:uncharacterized membrane protein YjfL (UPF0719 family)
MSGDELLALAVSCGLSVFTWYAWFAPLATVERFGARARGRTLLMVAPFASLAILFVVLKTLASSDVRDNVAYLGLYTLMGAAWTGSAMWLLPFLGISPGEDVAERRNEAAAIAVSGALIGCMLCFAGSNVGEGPGWWVVVSAAGLATAVLALLTNALDALTDVTDTITVDRDLSAGIRFAALLSAAGLLLGRGVAGDWLSFSATVQDLAIKAWPVVPLFAVAAAIERAARPTAMRPRPSVTVFGVLPGLLYLAAAVLYVGALGRPA